MDIIPEFLRDLNLVSIIFRLVLAVIFGGIIGIGREFERRPAGLRTHILVCIGAALAMITNIYISNMYSMTLDPTRIGAQVISGIGFLGAGTILVTGNKEVKGLTTAAGLWASACMGLAIGTGFYEGAIVGCIFIVLSTVILAKLENYIDKKSRVIDLYIEVDTPSDFSNLIKKLKIMKVKICEVEMNNSYIINKGSLAILLTLKIPKEGMKSEIYNFIDEQIGVLFIDEI